MLTQDAAKPSILVVDDMPENIDVLKDALKNDYIVRPAMNGAVALKIAASEPKPDLILLDIMMPEMDGYEVIRRLQANSNTYKIPVMFVTAVTDTESELKGLKLGAVDYITKPFNSAIVLARVRTHLELRDARIKLERQNRELKSKTELLEKLAHIDGLTNIPNRRSFDLMLEIEWGRALRNNSPLSIIIADIDHFKSYNDNYGHTEGDQCLCAVAQCLSSLMQRPTDMVARYGGEEFVAILPDTDVRGAALLAEHWRAGVEKMHIPHAHSKTTDHVTLSVGYASMIPSRNQIPYYLLGIADEMLYQSKDGGRNQVNGKEVPQPGANE